MNKNKIFLQKNFNKSIKVQDHVHFSPIAYQIKAKSILTKYTQPSNASDGKYLFHAKKKIIPRIYRP
jgi:hypothetical protein